MRKYIIVRNIQSSDWDFPGAAEPGGGAMGACAPPPLFLKVKKVPFFWAKVRDI